MKCWAGGLLQVALAGEGTQKLSGYISEKVVLKNKEKIYSKVQPKWSFSRLYFQEAWNHLMALG